jgi:hypothetical protein
MTMSTPADVLNLIKSITGKGVLSFQFIERGADQVDGYAAVEKMAATYKWLAGIGGDLYWYDAPLSVAADSTFITKYAIPYVQAGGLATLCASMPNPTTGNGQADTTVNGTDLMTPGTRTYDNFQTIIKQIGACLKPAADAGIPLKTRFFHELNGQWFWWGNLTDQQFVWAYQQLHDYLTKTLGYTNLLFCLALNAGLSSTLPFPKSRYPGDSYVDIFGIDGYTDFPADLANDVTWINQNYPNKPVWLSEFGSGSPSGGDTSFDMEVLVAALKAMPSVYGFQQWWSANSGIGWGIELDQDLPAFFKDPYVLWRDDVARLLGQASSQPTTPTPTPTPPATIVTTATDGSGVVWTLDSAGILYRNGVELQGGEDTAALAVVNGVPWMQDIKSKDWFTYVGGTFVPQNTAPPTGPIPTPTPVPTPPPTPSSMLTATDKQALLNQINGALSDAGNVVAELHTLKTKIQAIAAA